MLLQLAYLGVTNALAPLQLLPTSDRDKDAETLAPHHQITALQRQPHGESGVADCPPTPATPRRPSQNRIHLYEEGSDALDRALADLPA